MRHTILTLVAGAALLLAGCADPVVFSEVFQLSEGQKLYTAYNIWYTDPMDISSLNIQSGTFIPLGTEIIPVKTSSWDNGITFTDTKGKTFCIKFDAGYRLCSMRDYIEYTFTTKPPQEMLEGIPDKIRHRILRGEVMPGMNQAQVLLAYGPPPSARTPDLKNETWIYWISPSETVRVVFRGDTVRQMLNINQ